MDTLTRRRTFSDDLRLLNDVLAATPFGPRYWAWGGLLLGWAREGRLFDHDLSDADFGFLEADLDLFFEAAGQLIASGFRPLSRFVNNAGQVTEYCFARNDAKFEFFVTTPEDGELRYFVYSDRDSNGAPPMQATALVPHQPLETFSFLRRQWRKHVDHERELTAMYGDWRTPDPDFWGSPAVPVHDFS